MVEALTPEQMLWKGLELVGFNRCRTTAHDEALRECFRAHYGSDPIVYAKIWGDILKMQHSEGAALFLKKADVDAFLLAVHFLKAYPTECKQAALFKICERTAWYRAWYYVGKIQALKAVKVSIAMCLKTDVVTNKVVLCLSDCVALDCC